MPVPNQAAKAAALLATISMATTPALAAELPHVPLAAASDRYAPHEATVDESSDYHRRYRHRRHRVGAGDVLAGVLIIGGIAAIAGAANKNKRDERYRERDDRYRDRDYDYRQRDRRDSRRNSDARGLGSAVDMCLREIERDVRVEEVDEVNRDGDGWRVRGSLYNGEGFTCRIGSDGRVEDIDYGGRRAAAALAPIEDNQWDDNRYAQARDRIERQASTADVQPAYPGGPLPGEEIDGDIAAASGSDDGRYAAHEAPDFGEV